MARLGPYKIKNVEAALDAEDLALSKLHQVVSKQLIRLQMEERMMQVLLKKLTEGDPSKGADEREVTPPHRPSPSTMDSSDRDSSDSEPSASGDSFIDDPLVGVEGISDSDTSCKS